MSFLEDFIFFFFKVIYLLVCFKYTYIFLPLLIKSYYLIKNVGVIPCTRSMEPAHLMISQVIQQCLNTLLVLFFHITHIRVKSVKYLMLLILELVLLLL